METNIAIPQKQICKTCGIAGEYGYRIQGTMTWFCKAHMLSKNYADARLTLAEQESKQEVLLAKINTAVAEHNTAERAVTTAQCELVSKSKAVGQLLLEAKKLHPKVTDFEAFLKRVKGLKLSRAYDLLRVAGGRTTDEELRKDARERKQKSRAKKKPEPISVTCPPVTESKPTPRITASPEISADERRAQNAALDTKPDPTPPPDHPSTGAKRAELSRKALNEFKYACKNYLPQLTDEDWTSASMFWDEYAYKRGQESLKRKVA
jgi:hypothetical protein